MKQSAKMVFSLVMKTAAFTSYVIATAFAVIPGTTTVGTRTKNGIDWMWSEERTFKPTFMHTDGTNTSHISRQRPQLVFAPKRSGNETTSAASSNSGSIVPTQLITGISVSSTNHPFPWQQSCGTELCSISNAMRFDCDVDASSASVNTLLLLKATIYS